MGHSLSSLGQEEKFYIKNIKLLSCKKVTEEYVAKIGRKKHEGVHQLILVISYK